MRTLHYLRTLGFDYLLTQHHITENWNHQACHQSQNVDSKSENMFYKCDPVSHISLVLTIINYKYKPTANGKDVPVHAMEAYRGYRYSSNHS
jgi:hypothetical protein